MVNPCLILGFNSLDKIAGIIFIGRQEIPRNIEPSPFLTIGHHSQASILPKPLTYLRCRLGLIVLPKNLCPFRKLCLAGLVSYHTKPVCARLHQWWYLMGGQTVHHPQRSVSFTQTLLLIFFTVLKEGASFLKVSMKSS